MTTPTPAEARARRRRHLHQRQTVILGTLVLALAGTLLLAWLMWGGVIPSPFERDFSSPPAGESDTVACPLEGAQTVPYSEITASVYNSTNQAGLARSVADALATVGVTINQAANWDELGVGQGSIRTGVNGLEEAYTLAQSFPAMRVTKDAREDAVVDIVLGADFGGVGDLNAVSVGVPIPLPAECQPDAPTETAGTETPEGTAPAEAPTEEAPAEG